MFDAKVKKKLAATLEEQWHARFAGEENDILSVTADYFTQAAARVSLESSTVSEHWTKDGSNYKSKYFAHVQNVFSRVQHHMHKRTRKGIVPLKSCQKKGSKSCIICKHDFPKQTACDAQLPRSVLICRGVARKFGVKVSGRRNQLGALLGCRSDPWQSGAAPSFAAAFGSNTHALPDWRLPLSAETHEDEFCSSRKCQESMNDQRKLNITAKIAQRAQRQCTGYY